MELDFPQYRTIVLRASDMHNDTPSPPPSDINIRVSFQTFDDSWIVEQDLGLWQFCERRRSSITVKVFSFNVDQFKNHEEACKILHELLDDWPVSDSTREIVVKFILKRTGCKFESLEAPCDITSTDLHFCVVTVNTYVLDEGGILVEGSDDSCMIPAAESSIDLLELKKIDYGGSCSICLDDLCEGLCMPCMHVFHQDCIKKWLKTSHFCPLCRFEMPTAIAA